MSRLRLAPRGLHLLLALALVATPGTLGASPITDGGLGIPSIPMDDDPRNTAGGGLLGQDGASGGANSPRIPTTPDMTGRGGIYDMDYNATLAGSVMTERRGTNPSLDSFRQSYGMQRAQNQAVNGMYNNGTLPGYGGGGGGGTDFWGIMANTFGALAGIAGAMAR